MMRWTLLRLHHGLANLASSPCRVLCAAGSGISPFTATEQNITLTVACVIESESVRATGEQRVCAGGAGRGCKSEAWAGGAHLEARRDRSRPSHGTAGHPAAVPLRKTPEPCFPPTPPRCRCIDPHPLVPLQGHSLRKHGAFSDLNLTDEALTQRLGTEALEGVRLPDEAMLRRANDETAWVWLDREAHGTEGAFNWAPRNMEAYFSARATLTHSHTMPTPPPPRASTALSKHRDPV